jgi:threonylcarbamoyladenosine tRNA methylthiotransferase MtaB
MTTVTLATLGCKVNQFESEAIIDSLEHQGYRTVPFGDLADITIINTCTVTHRADFQSRQMVRKALRFSPNSLVIVTGCYAQVDPQAFAETKGVTYLLGNREKYLLPNLLPQIEQGRMERLQISDIEKETQFLDVPLYSFHRHTRAFLKIQDGCDAHCSYCIVPHARGRSRSLSLDRIIGHCARLKEKGFKEVVLTGIHIGSYGQDFSSPFSLEKLLERLEHAETPPRIRLSSIEPLDFSPALISFLTQSLKVCPHLHIPIQSADDDILRKMNRDYASSFLSSLINDLYRRIPQLSLGADVIVGFPGETETQFQHTRELIETLPFSYLHVFPFSGRKGTPASRFPHPVRESIITERAETLRTLGNRKRQSFYGKFLHQELNVLVQDRQDKRTGYWKGLSRNYVPVLITHDGNSREEQPSINQEWRVHIIGVNDTNVIGTAAERIHG